MLTYAALIFLITQTLRSRENDNVISLYQRPIIPIDPDRDTFPLYVGLTKDHKISAKKLPFVLDLNYDHTLITDKVTCDDLGYCKVTGDSNQSDTYNGTQYKYTEAKTLVAPQVVSPAEISKSVAEAVSRSRIRLVQDGMSGSVNVLGLSPIADTWSDWNNEYFLRFEALNITYHRYPSHDYILFYSKISNNDVMVNIKKDKKYIFDAKFNDDTMSKDVSVCVKTNQHVFFELNDDLYQEIKGLVCKSGSPCQTKSDLKSDLKGQFSLTVTDSDTGKTMSATINVKDLVNLAEDEETLVLNFYRNTDTSFSDCDIVLQNMFFENYYLLISNSLKDSNKIRIGLRKIQSSDFFMKNLWKYLLILTIVVLGIIIVVFTIRGCKKPAVTDSEYTTLPFTQTNKEKND